MHNFRGYSQCIVTQSWYRPFADNIRVTEKSTTYMIGKPFLQGPLYVTSYAGRVTIASTEFKVLSSLKNVKLVPKHVGVIMQNFRRCRRCIVTQSSYRQFVQNVLYAKKWIICCRF